MSFVHLHVHSHYSLLDGFGTPKDIVKAAVDHGSPAIALTDHGSMYGAIEFYIAAKEYGIKPIIGCEVYVAPKSRFDKIPGPENKPYHLTLLALNEAGYRNLMLLVTKAYLEGFYYKPRVDHGLLKAHSEGLVALSGCLAGEMAKAVLQGKEEKPLETIKIHQDIFGKDNFFLELQNHALLDDQKILNERLIELAKANDIPMVASQDSHYIHKNDAKAQDILLCIQTQTTIDQEDRMKFEGDFSLLCPDEMKELFKHVPEAIENTLKIADRANVEIKFGQNLIPKFKTPANEPAHEYLIQLCDSGLNMRYNGSPSEEARKRLVYELEIVNKMGFSDYFLIVWDFVKFAKDRGIVVGPGRGSAAGSLITYCLEITDLDPLKYGLIFERFLNPERISMPDVDIDFADTRRDEVLEYVREKYGRDNVAQIITFGTMAARAAVRDVGRAMGYPYAEVDRIAKLVPPPLQGKHIPLKKSIKEDPELKKVYETEERSRDLLDNAVKLEGTVRHAGTHACAVVMSERPLVEYVPLQRSTGGGEEIITQYDMHVCDDIGLLKMDFLGLKNLTIIENTIQILRRTAGIDLDVTAIPMDNETAYKLLQRGDTTGVFQLESAGMRRYIKELKPTRFEDIIAMISLYRPGPMEWIPGYIKAQHNPESVRYLHSSFEPILKETNGVAIYQEQILQIARDFAGFTLGEADILRKAVGKKIGSLLNEQKAKFIQGAVANNHDEKFAAEVFEKVIEPFAGYGFNKSHAACYAMISYRTAYLKALYPTEFMAALLSADSDNTDRIVMEIMECEEMGIAVLPPSINESFANFTVVEGGNIRFGLSAIKGLGASTVEEILAVRGDGIFTSLDNLLQRVPVKLLNKKTMEALAYSGALDDLGERRAIALSTDEISSYAKSIQEMSLQGQESLFGNQQSEALSPFNLKKVKPASNMDRLRWEKEYLGIYVSGHPLKGLKKYLSKKVILIGSITKKNIGKKIILGGLIARVKKVFTKSGSYMIYGELEDPTGRVEIVLFPKVYNQYHHLIDEDKIVIMEGRLDHRRDALQFAVDSVKAVSLETMINNAKEAGLYNENENIMRRQKTIEVELKGKKVGTDLRREPDVAGEGVVMETAEKHTIDAGNTEWSENPYVIDVPEGTDMGILKELKSLLLENQGERQVEIHLAQKGPGGIAQTKRVRIPFGIHITDELESDIDKVFKKA
ncbi:DNA polymerase III subunit alpha [Patescibacteria group bacterium]|nr:DNA polymerase III subunit alpha [Patescibacteria group bacterium]MBU1954103.1 DNA polymerase III subunit alpha [Patescibacteria group bacterium]